MEQPRGSWFADLQKDGARQALATMPAELKQGEGRAAAAWGLYPDTASLRNLVNYMNPEGK